MKRLTFGLTFMAVFSSALAAQDATTRLYGDFRYSYNRADAGDTSYWAGANNASRLGVRADLAGRSFTVFADLQVGVSVEGDAAGAVTQRYWLAGIRGAPGTLTIGRHSTAYKMSGLRLDPFYDTSTLSAGGAVPSAGLFAGASFGLSGLTNGWADRTIAYASPAIMGFTANAAAYLDTESDHDYGLGLGYQRAGFHAGVQYHDVGGGRTWAPTAGVADALRGHVSYEWKDLSVGGSFERVHAAGGGSQDFMFAAATFDATPELMLAAGVGLVEAGPLQPVTGTGFHGGVFYALYPQARVHALYSRLGPDVGPDRGNLALGFTYNFALEVP
jgi:hypothetical protein